VTQDVWAGTRSGVMRIAPGGNSKAGGK
jgi:hypothetical protein